MPTVAERYKFSDVEQDGRNFFSDLSEGCKTHNAENITLAMLQKLGTKDVLTDWLFKALQLIIRQHNFAINQRVYISQYKNDIISLQSDLLQYKGDVIKLQSDLIDANKDSSNCCEKLQFSEEFSDSIEEAVERSVKKNFKLGMGKVEKCISTGIGQSYSEVVASGNVVNSGASIISSETVKTVAKQIIAEDELSKNLMVFNLPEADNEDVHGSVGEVFEELGEKPKLEAVRLGTKMESKVRPVKVTLSSASVVQQILSKSRKLRVTDKFKSVYLSADRSVEERSRRRELVVQLKEKKEAEPTKRHYIKGDEILSVDLKNNDNRTESAG